MELKNVILKILRDKNILMLQWEKNYKILETTKPNINLVLKILKNILVVKFNEKLIQFI